MKVMVVGAGGHGRVVADIVLESGLATDVDFLDDRFPGLQSTGPWPVVGVLADMRRMVDAYSGCVIAFGDWQARRRAHELLRGLGVPVLTPVHPSAVVSRHAVLGEGSVVCAGAVVGVLARIGRGCIVNTGATVDHDCRLADWVHVCPGAHLSGSVVVGEGAWIGVGAVVRQGATIGARVTVGAGAACVTDLPDDVVAVGVPARPRRRTGHPAG